MWIKYNHESNPIVLKATNGRKFNCNTLLELICTDKAKLCVD